MEIEQLRQELTRLLDEIVNQSNQLSNKKEIPSLEIGVVLDRVNKLQDRLYILRYLIEEAEKNETDIDDSIKITVVQEMQEGVIGSVENAESEKIKVERIVPEDVFNDNTTASVADQLQQTSFGKLADAFNLNDRYLFANELFNKDMSAFNNLIIDIDQSASLAEAQVIINQAKQSFNWDEENQRVIDMVELVERKFA